MRPSSPKFITSLLRLAVLVALLVLVNLALNVLLEQLSHNISPNGRLLLNSVLVLCLLSYALLMAMPFVPSIEIGMSLLMMQGPDFAPLVFLATFSGLSIAFLLGYFLPYRILHRFFADLGATRVAQLLERTEMLDRKERLAVLNARLPRLLRPVFGKFRYLTLALALNVPGNAVVGGGGGIAMIAGLSGLFSRRAALLTLALAVAPVPLAVFAFGFDFLEIIGH